MKLLRQGICLSNIAAFFLFSLLLHACGGSSGSVQTTSSAVSISSSPSISSVSSSSSSIDPTSLDINVAPIARNFYGAMHEPEQGILHGAGQDIDGFKDYAVAVGPGNHPILYMTYVGLAYSPGDVEWWGQELIHELSTLPADVIPQIGVNFTLDRDNGSGQAAALVRGDYDAQIAALVKAIKKLNRKNFVRIGYEFEGSWNGYEAKNYVLAYQKITKALRDGDTNSATVWCSAGGFAGFWPWSMLSAYYPGDEYVDWFGIDIFDSQELFDPRLVAFLQKADEHKKPVMIGETSAILVGTFQGQDQWDAWFRPFYRLLYQNPQIKAFCYISWDWAYWAIRQNFNLGYWGDARIEKNAYVNVGARQELKKSIFVHSSGK